jgi:predicted alpha/beta-fold hydrolase
VTAPPPTTVDDVAQILPFDPPRWLGNRHLQSLLPSLPLRRGSVERRAGGLIDASRELILDCGDGVRLLAMHATQEALGRAPSRQLVVIQHGWEGSADSLYLLSLGQALLDAGFDVIRLNLRDHGPTHHLNLELFHSCRIAEVVGAIARIQQLNPHKELSLAGFSLGGNFALRVGARAAGAGLRLKRIVAVCPVLDPAVTLEALERGPAIYREYFLLKWRSSLKKKQAAWPQYYDFGELMGERSLTTMTARMVMDYAGYPDLASYLAGYAITGEALATLGTESRIITALDDPIILPGDLARLKRVDALRITATRRGGHCGFRERLGASWIDREIVTELTRA